MFRFPWGDMHSLNLGWFLQKFNELREDWATAEAGIDGALDAEIQRAEDALSDVFDARDAAAASATAAAGSAGAANTSATAAQNSATAAASSATLANNKATAAGLSEAAAAQSATAASNSATAAATSATQAGNSATAAGNSATTAGQEATNAAGSATAAAGSAAAAAASETAAAASAARAEEVEESIPPDYTTLSNDVSNLKTAVNSDTEIVYNQYAKKTASWSKNFGTATVINVGNDEIQGTNGVIDTYAYNGIIQNFVSGHKYLFMGIASKQGGAIGLYSYISNDVKRSLISSADPDNTEKLLSIIDFASRTTTQEYNMQLRIFSSNVTQFMFKQVRCFDLTEMNLESIETVDEFIAVFPEWYTIENTGETRYLTKIEENAINIAKLDNRVSTLEALVLENIGG